MVGARLLASAPAWLSGSTPSARSKTAAGTANTASGHPLGRATAHASVATRSTTASVSAIGLGTMLQIVSPKGLVRMQTAWMRAYGKRTEYSFGS